ncbi:MAG: hypothetical protein ACRD16_05100 [Thermoanaerobaculia bacterium]
MRKASPFILVAAAFVAAGSTRAALASGEALVFAVSAQQAPSGLSSAEVRQIFLGRVTRWKGGRRIALGIRPAATEAGREFFDRVVHMSEIDFTQHWLGIIFRGEAPVSPRLLKSSQDVKQFLIKDGGGLAFLLSSEVTAKDSGIRVLLLDGARADERSYPFRLP